MANKDYLQGRQKYKRPQAVLWSKNQGYLDNGFYVPFGTEVGASNTIETDPDLVDQFLILSDHNRGPIDFTPDRIEKRERMINGKMRSHYVADKKSATISWTMLPSRSSGVRPDFLADGNKSDGGNFTVDEGAGGVEMLTWHQENKGPFWMFLAYDKYTDFGTDDASYQHLNKYNERLHVYITNFTYSVVKRGHGTYDMWDVSVTLEEV